MGDLARRRSRALSGAAGGSRRHGQYGRFPSGATATDRRQKFALPPGNTAEFESPISLVRDQLLLEGKVAPQPQWGFGKVGGGWQVVAAGGKYTGAVKRCPPSQN